MSFKEYCSRRSQKVPSTSVATTTSIPTQVTSSSEHSTHIPVHPVSPVQKINAAASLLLTPRTVSLTNLVRAPVQGVPSNNTAVVSTVPVVASPVVANGVSPSSDVNHVTPMEIVGNKPTAEHHGEVDMNIEPNDADGENFIQLGTDGKAAHIFTSKKFPPLSKKKWVKKYNI